MNARGADVVEGDLAQFALTTFLETYWSFLRISLDINFSPIKPRPVANSGTIMGKSPPF